MDDKKTDKSKRIVRIVVPLFILIVLAAIWAVKTNPASTLMDEQTGIVGDFVLEATSIDLASLKNYNLPIIIDFGADSCAPCKEMAPVLKTLNEEMQDKAIIKFVDVWKNKDAANDFPVQVIPTQVFILADGSPYVPSEDIGIKFDMYSYTDTGEHAFTVHQGGLTEEEMRTILADMEGNQ